MESTLDQEYEINENWSADPADGSYNPQWGDRVTYKDGGFPTQDGILLDISVPYYILRPPFQAFRKFDQREDGSFLPVFVPRDPGVRADVQRATFGDTNPAQWPTSKYGKRDPWMLLDIIYLMQPDTMKILTLQHHTVGFQIAVRELKNTMKLQMARSPLPVGYLPAIMLEAKVPFKTRYGTRDRPNFKLLGWRPDPLTATQPQVGTTEAPKQIEEKKTNGSGQLNMFVGQNTAEAATPPLSDPLNDEIPF
jgi:hypothetical protein